MAENEAAEIREQAAKIVEEGYVCRSCGHVGSIIECCDHVNIDAASNEQIAAAIRAIPLGVVEQPDTSDDDADEFIGFDPEPPFSIVEHRLVPHACAILDKNKKMVCLTMDITKAEFVIRGLRK